MKSPIICGQCGDTAFLENGAIARAHRTGAPLYCGRQCSGLARRKDKSVEQRKEEKRLYDAAYREREAEKLKADKAAYYQRTRDPVREAEVRKKRMPLHVEYCRRPEYRKWKAEYDRKHLARKQFGDFGQAAIILRQLEDEISSRITRTEIYRENGILNKHQTRRRDYERQTQRR